MLLKAIFTASLIGAISAQAALAADSITFKLTNSTGRTITLYSSSCSPSDSTCTIPSTISNNTTANVVINSVHGAGVGPLMIARYGYNSSGTNYSCQLTVRATKNSSNSNICVNPVYGVFPKTDGTATAPSCGGVSVVTQDANNCIYVLSATMN